MRRNTTTKTTLALAGLSGLLLGTTMDCSVPLCDERPGDPRCTADGGTTADLVLSTTRLSKNGGRVNITAKVATGTAVKLVLPGNLEVGCTVDASGSGSCDVSMAQLASVTPGQISVTLKAADKTLSTKLRIFQPPTFMDAAGMKATLSTGARQPAWVQVAKGHVFSAEDSVTNRRIGEYVISGTTFQGVTNPREPFVNTMPLTTMLDVSENQVVRATLGAGMFSVENADLAATVDTYTSFKMLNLTKVNSVAASRDSTVVAVAGEGTDGPLKAYTLPAPGQTNSNAVTLTGATTKAVTRVGVGKLSDTSGPDIIAAHADGASVFLQKTGTAAPALDQTLSTMVGAKLIGPGLTAMAVGDIDRDGLDDIVAVQGASIIVLSIDGTTVTSTPVLSNLPMTVDAAAVGDVSGDGKPDLVIGQKAGAMLTVFINQAQ